jgi:hypothetical protein
MFQNCNKNCVLILQHLLSGKYTMYSDFQLQVFSSTKHAHQLKRHNQLPIHWILTAPFLGVTEGGHEANCSPLSSPEIKNECSYTSAPPICFHDVHRDSFTFLLLLLLLLLYIYDFNPCFTRWYTTEYLHTCVQLFLNFIL